MAWTGPVNALTERWAAACSGSSTVVAGPGAWPVLALLAAGAAGKARTELEGALGIDAATAAAAARSVLATLTGSPETCTALGLWTRREVPLLPAWAASLPSGTRGTLTGVPATDRPRLDTWASDWTGGLIPAMPVSVNESTLLILATALAVRIMWHQPFTEAPGTFEGHRVHALRRRTRSVDQIHVAETPNGPLTLLSVTGTGGIDVHLVLGEPFRPAGDVLTAGIDALCGRHPSRTAGALPTGHPGPGLTLGFTRAYRPEDHLDVTVPRFTVRAEHDLLALPEVFGLDAVTDASRGHFPGISPAPLAVSQAAQNTMATFQALGFEGAALTTATASYGQAATGQPPYRVKKADFTIERPFGFITVHRESGLILTTGWVNDADPYTDPYSGAWA